MRSLLVILWGAGFLQILIALANLTLPKKLTCRGLSLSSGMFSSFIPPTSLGHCSYLSRSHRDLLPIRRVGKVGEIPVRRDVFVLVVLGAAPTFLLSSFGNAALVAVTLYLAASCGASPFLEGFSA